MSSVLQSPSHFSIFVILRNQYMKKVAAFVQEHIGDDTAKLILNRAKWPEIDVELAVASIESRRKLKNKVQEWCDHPDLVFPVRLSAEQCSSSATAEYKAKLAERIAGPAKHIADLTGGLGVDSWFFSKHFSEVLYNEMQEPLCMAAEYNFEQLEAKNINVSNLEIQANIPALHELLNNFRPDIVFIDPARRGEGGKKVFLIEDCTPDVLTLRNDIFTHCRHLLIKLSPMADISMVCHRLGAMCREVHVVACGGECKELLIWMDREWQGAYSITAVEISRQARNDSISTLSSRDFSLSSRDLSLSSRDFSLSSRDLYLSSRARPEAESRDLLSLPPSPLYLFEPGKALMKAGFFDLIRDYFAIDKLAVSTHYFITDDAAKVAELQKFGKVYSIISIQPLDKRTIKAAGKEYPHAEVTARNIPMDTETLRKKLGVTSGDDAHIFGLKSDRSGNLLIIGKRLV
jgi:hypothetical protein